MRLLTLGTAQLLHDDGQPVAALSQPRRLALLAMVAAAGRHGASRDKVMTCLWPDSERDRARHALAQAVYTLRRTTGDQSLIQGEHQLRLNPSSLSSDVAEFLEAAAAGNHARVVQLYTGDFLDGFTLPDSPAFDKWMETERARFRDIVATARAATPSPSSPSSSPSPSSPPSPPSPPRRLAMLVGLAIVVATLAALFFIRTTPKGPAAAPIASLAVLPFANLGSDALDALVSDGIAEDLITRLGRVSGLRIVARTSSFSLRHRQLSAQQVGELLHVSAVLEGSMRRNGDSVRVTTRLVDTRNGYELWSRSFDRSFLSLFSLQDDVARGIADALKHDVLDRLPNRPPALATRSLEAYVYYLQGRHAWTERSAKGLRRAFAYFDSALTIDPTYSAAEAGIAATWLVAPTYGVEAPPRPYVEAQHAAERAIAHDSNNAEALGVSALARQLVEGDLDGAEMQFRRAILIEPQDATLRHWHALNLLVSGAPDSAIAEVRAAHALDPLSPAVGTGVAVIEYFAGHPGTAVVASRAVLQQEPDFFAARNWLGLSLLATGDTIGALGELERVVRESHGDARYRASLAYALASAGRHDSARVLLEGLDADRKRLYVPSVNLALAHAAAGDNETALALLQRAQTERDPGILTLSLDPKARALKADPRFSAALVAPSRVNRAPSR